MLELNDLEQHSIVASGGLFGLRCIFSTGSKQIFYYKGKDALYFDCQKLLIAASV